MNRPSSSTPKRTVCGQCGTRSRSSYDRRPRVARDLSCGLLQIYLEFEGRRVGCPHCGVKREKLDWLADNRFCTKRFAYSVGRRCRDSTIGAIAEELDLDWKTVKDLDKQHVREELQRVGCPTPRVIGLDEVSLRKGHTYRIVVSDWLRRRPEIWRPTNLDQDPTPSRPDHRRFAASHDHAHQ